MVNAVSWNATVHDVLQTIREAGVTDLAVTFVGPNPIHDMAFLHRAVG